MTRASLVAQLQALEQDLLDEAETWSANARRESDVYCSNSLRAYATRIAALLASVEEPEEDDDCPSCGMALWKGGGAPICVNPDCSACDTAPAASVEGSPEPTETCLFRVPQRKARCAVLFPDDARMWCAACLLKKYEPARFAERACTDLESAPPKRPMITSPPAEKPNDSTCTLSPLAPPLTGEEFLSLARAALVAACRPRCRRALGHDGPHAFDLADLWAMIEDGPRCGAPQDQP